MTLGCMECGGDCGEGLGAVVRRIVATDPRPVASSSSSPSMYGDLTNAVSMQQSRQAAQVARLATATTGTTSTIPAPTSSGVLDWFTNPSSEVISGFPNYWLVGGGLLVFLIVKHHRG